MQYDYIVVGAGSSGAALAARLVELTNCSVLLLEAGPDYRSAEAPVEMRQAYSLPLLDTERFARFWWKSQARRTRAQEPQPWPRGRGVGGCSAVNVQVAVRGIPDDYDEWAADGCSGWSYRDVLGSFVRMESDHDFPDASYHGNRGPVPIERPARDSMGPVDVALADAAVGLGYGWAADHNAPDATGASPAAHNSRGGSRVSTNDGYIEPLRGRGSLAIRGDVLVDRVLFDRSRAVGVRARTAAGWTTFEGGEVVLCAGAIYSPAILMRSGIGAASHLQELGIKPLQNLPVGSGLNDHPSINLSLVLSLPSTEVADKFAVNCLVRFSSQIEAAGRNDMGFISFNFFGEQPDDRMRGELLVTLFRSFSRGTVRLRSDNPEVDPVIDFNMLSDDRDLARMRDGVRRLFELAAHPALASITESGGVGEIVAANELPRETELDHWLLEHCDTIGHPCGSARMGAATDPRAVLDAACRVLGVDGLRVADASSMPSTPRANNHLSCIMLAEHLASWMASSRSESNATGQAT